MPFKVTQKRSIIGVKPPQRNTIRSLGLKRINHTVVIPDNAVNRGYLHAVRHLIEVQEIEEAEVAADVTAEGER